MTGSTSELNPDQPAAVAYDSQGNWYPRSIAVTFNNDKILVIRPDTLVAAYWEPLGTKVSDDHSKVEAVAMRMRIDFWVEAPPGIEFDVDAIEILDLLKPAMIDMNEMIQQVRDVAEKAEDDQAADSVQDSD
jgi:hypothetical protein